MSDNKATCSDSREPGSEAVIIEPIFAEHVNGAAVTLRLVGVQRTTIKIQAPPETREHDR